MTDLIPQSIQSNQLQHPAPMSAVEFHDFYVLNMPKVKAYLSRRGCPKSQVDDVIQTTFLLAWRKRGTFRGSAPFSAFLFGIAKHLLRNARRDAKYECSRLDANHPASLIKSGMIWSELPELVKRSLTLEQWQAVELISLHTLKMTEAAEQANCSPSVFRARLYRARKTLQRLMNAYNR
jgi:RNA polymerase sigma-70 factor (ECF subfamily)